MSEVLVLCGGLVPSDIGRRAIVELDVSPAAPEHRRIDFDTAKLSRPLVDDIPDILGDALEIAAYVHCADRLVRRGGFGAGPSIGSEWQRDLRFRIPVRCIEVWQRLDVRSTLVEALTFLSGDRLAFEFAAASSPGSLEPFLGFQDKHAHTIRPEQVMLFSGGLDSLAGVARDVFGEGKRAILVTHRSANAITNLQDRLAQTILDRTAAGQVLHLPVRLNRGNAQPREHSQRFRSFLFATLGLVYARMFGLSTVTFYENGVTSFNLPVAEHVMGTRASRTTHPHVLSLYGRLFSLLLREKVEFVNPFVWQTKAEIVRTIVDHGLSDLIKLTTSCAGVRSYSMTGQQCGVCSQCVERRVAMIAAGVEDSEEPYQHDMFLGPIEDPKALTMIGGHLLRARRLSTMSMSAFFSNQGQMFHALQDLGEDARGAAERVFRLHQGYGKEFIGAIEQQLARHATIEGMRQIHPQSLLGMLQNRPAQALPFQDPVEQLPPETVERGARPPVPVPHSVTVAVDQAKKLITISAGPTLRGQDYRILAKLVADAQEQVPLQPAGDRKYCLSRTLAAHIGVDEAALRKAVSRLRRRLSKKYEDYTGYRLDQEDVVQNRPWQGYRLNPHVLVIPPELMAVQPKLSRLRPSSVTTQHLAT